MHGQQNIKIPS